MEAAVELSLSTSSVRRLKASFDAALVNELVAEVQVELEDLLEVGFEKVMADDDPNLPWPNTKVGRLD